MEVLANFCAEVATQLLKQGGLSLLLCCLETYLAGIGTGIGTGMGTGMGMGMGTGIGTFTGMGTFTGTAVAIIGATPTLEGGSCPSRGFVVITIPGPDVGGIPCPVANRTSGTTARPYAPGTTAGIRTSSAPTSATTSRPSRLLAACLRAC